MTTLKGPGLYEFLMESELQQYYAGIKNDLKIQNVPQLKYVAEEDLHQIGMSKPEMRRLKKYFQKYYPQNYIYKFKKMLLTKRDDQPCAALTLPEERRDGREVKIPNKHMIPVEAIIVNKELGQGEFGVVQQGVWTNDGDRIQVAIKCLSRERMQNNPIEFLKEAAIMHAIDHEHIVRLYGCVLDANALMLVTELAPLRSLLECLKEPSLRSSFPVLSLCDFAVQVCDGMQYLETKRLIHRDLAARNILVFSKHKVKISDFGLSRALGVGKDYYQTNFNVNLKLPIAWCAPECISYLRFTHASDVWAYGVTLWEMFSYGFQPWAALTGHQILEAIDSPNYQRLEQPECCPREYFSLMLKCWQHDPNKRPRFADLAIALPECKPEQVQAVQELTGDARPRDLLLYRVGDIITVLDKGAPCGFWKGVLNNGKTGLFNPAHSVSYLGSDLPSNKPGEFVRGDTKTISVRRRLRTDMISSPQGEVKHTGHVGLDGAYFGDISFLGGKYQHLPQQVVTPYKPSEDSSEADAHSLLSRTCSDVSDQTPLLTGHDPAKVPSSLSEKKAGGAGKSLTDHEYHEISDEEAVDSPRFEKSFDFGPSLLDEMDAVFRSLGGSPPPSPGLPPPLDETVNVRNELREMAAKVTSRKKQATVKPISASDQRTLDSAIAMANELATRSMNDLDGCTPPESPRTPTTPGKRKFSFRFPAPGGQDKGKAERRTFSDEAASIPDIQSTISDAAREVYTSLVEQPQPSLSPSPPSAETNPLRMLRSKAFPVVRPRVRGNKHNLEPSHRAGRPNTEMITQHNVARATLPKLRVPPPPTAPPPIPSYATGKRSSAHDCDGGLDSGRASFNTGFPYGDNDAMAPLEVKSIRGDSEQHDGSSDGRRRGRERSEGDGDEDVFEDDNPIPLPPRDRTRPFPPTKPRHTRKHPLVIPVSRALAKMTDTAGGGGSISGEDPESGCEQGPAKLSVKSMDDSFDQQIACELAALDDMPDECETPDDLAMIRHSDHVSCEDLLEFACDTPNAKRTRGKAQGVSSDEVRIMGKVLGPEVSAEDCVLALNASDWDVHRAIKLARLHALLRGSQDLETCNQALDSCAWDVARAASWVLANQEQGDTTQV